MVNIIKQEIVIEELLKKKKADLKDLIHLVKKKLKKQLRILMAIWMNYAEEFYNDKNDKEKDDGLSL